MESRQPILDGIRALAILMVLAWHCLLPAPTSVASSLVHFFFSSFWLGVDVFFVLSGYLITRILIKSSKAPFYFGRFYWRRTLRIFPAYYLTLLAVVAIMLWHRADDQPILDSTRLVAFGTYMQNWWLSFSVSAGTSGFNQIERWAPHLWSLAVEEQFYLIWPAVIWAIARTGTNKPRVSSCIAGIYLFVVICKLCVWLLAFDGLYLYFASSARVDAILVGAFVAARELEKEALAGDWLFWAGVVLLFALLILHGYYLSLFPDDHWLRLRHSVAPVTILASLLTASLLAYLCSTELPHWIKAVCAAAMTRHIAAISYGLYLVHYPIYRLMRTELAPQLASWGLRGNTAVLVLGIGVIAVSWVVAWLMFRYFEQPILRFRDVRESRLFPS